MKFEVLALLGLVTVGSIKIDHLAEDEDQLLLVEDNEELIQTDEMKANEQMIEK
jgi:hypothetical protein